MNILANPFGYDGILPTPSLFIVLIVGNVIGFCLYGALTVQLYIYYISFHDHAKTVNVTVYVIYLIETVYTAMLAYDLTSLVLHPCKERLSTLLVPVCGGLVTLLTQAVYAYRIWTITRTKPIPFFIVALIAIEAVFTIVLIRLHLSFYVVSLVWSISNLIADCTIAFIMVRTLTKDEILSKQLQWRIARLVHIILGCCILTVNIAMLVTSLYSLDITLCCGIVLSKLYANGTMVLINDRQFHSGDKGPSVDDMSISFKTTLKSQDEQSLNPSDSGGPCESKEQVQDASLHV